MSFGENMDTFQLGTYSRVFGFGREYQIGKCGCSKIFLNQSYKKLLVVAHPQHNNHIFCLFVYPINVYLSN